jgi:hypothetical protein
LEVNSADLVSVFVEGRSIGTVVEAIEFVVSSLDLNFDSQVLLLSLLRSSFLGLELLELHGFLLEFSDSILIKASIVITVGEFAGFFLKGGWSDLKEIVVEVVSVMMMVLSHLVSVHVFTFHLDPFVHSVKRLTVEVSSRSIFVVVETLEWVESSFSVSNIGIVLSFCSSGGGVVLSNLFVDNGLLTGCSNFTGFLFSLINGVIIILSSFMRSLHHVEWDICHVQGVLIGFNISLGHHLSDRNWSTWLWENDFLIHTAEFSTFDELNMSIRGMVETIKMSMGVSESLGMSLLSLFGSKVVFGLLHANIFIVMCESSGNIDSLIDFTIFIFDGGLALVLTKPIVGAIDDSTSWEFG